MVAKPGAGAARVAGTWSRSMWRRGARRGSRRGPGRFADRRGGSRRRHIPGVRAVERVRDEEHSKTTSTTTIPRVTRCQVFIRTLRSSPRRSAGPHRSRDGPTHRRSRARIRVPGLASLHPSTVAVDAARAPSTQLDQRSSHRAARVAGPHGDARGMTTPTSHLIGAATSVRRHLSGGSPGEHESGHAEPPDHGGRIEPCDALAVPVGPA